MPTSNQVRSGPRVVTICLTVLAVLSLVACSSGSKKASGSAQTTPSGGTTSAPKQGGQLTSALLFLPSSLDPIRNPGYGGAGGEEMHGLYGNLILVNSNTGQQIPGGMAQSLTSSSDLSTWTLKLRAGLSFTDGEPFDAAAVIKSISRFKDSKLHATTQTSASLIATMNAPDPTTVVFTLSEPYAPFAAQLAGPLGYVAAPNFLDKLDGGDTTATPVGAGPFKFVSFKPDEALVLSRNTQYWGGAPYLDTVTFQTVPSASGTFQAFQSGQFNIANIYDPTIYQQIQQQKIPNFALPIFGTSGTVFNARAGKIFADSNLRQAVAMAVDPTLFNQRVWGGNLPIVGNQFVAKESQWATPADKGVPIDSAKAKSLVDAVKKDKPSWDGSVDFVCYTGGGGAPENQGLVLKSLLDPIGFKVNITKNLDTNQFVQRVAVNHQFDMACWGGWSFLDYDPYGVLFASLFSSQPGNLSGIGSPAMDASLNDLRVAVTVDQKKAAMAKFNTAWNDLTQGVIHGSLPLANVYSSKVQGLTFSGRSIPLLEKTWLS